MNKVKAVMIIILMMIAIVGLIHSKHQEIEEVTEETLQTKIALYYTNPKTGELEKEYRNVHVNEIEQDMLGTIIKELIKGPQNQELESDIPKGTKINHTAIDHHKAIVDFSKEFLENEEEEKQLRKIYAVVNAVTEITEIEEVEIDVEGNFYTQKTRL